MPFFRLRITATCLRGESEGTPAMACHHPLRPFLKKTSGRARSVVFARSSTGATQVSMSTVRSGLDQARGRESPQMAWLGRDDLQSLRDRSPPLFLLWRQNVDHLFYSGAEENRQDYPPPRPNLTLLTFEAERPPPPRVVQQELLMAAEDSGEYF